MGGPWLARFPGWAFDGNLKSFAIPKLALGEAKRKVTTTEE